jgi:hypothetical protein
MTGPASKGFSRVTWNLRYPSLGPASAGGSRPGSDDDDEDTQREGPSGHLALPGKYSVTLAKRVNGVETELAGPQTFAAVPLNNATLPAADKPALIAFQKKVAELQRAALGASRVVDDVKGRIALMKKALHDAPAAPAQLRADVLALETKTNDIYRALRGDNTLRSRFEGTPPTLLERINDVVGDIWSSSSAPTQTHIRNYEIAGEEFAPLLSNLKSLVNVDIKRVEDAMEASGAPCTPGRIPVWQKP